MQFDIELSFKATNCSWPRAFITPEGKYLLHFPPDLLAHFPDMAEIFTPRAPIHEYGGFVETWTRSGENDIHMSIVTGSEAPALAELILNRLHVHGGTEISAKVYSDECDHIEDDDGVLHRCGLHFFIEAGTCQCRDYPEIEDQYY